MRTVLYALSFLAVMGLAFWAYRENYATQKSLNHVEALQDEIAMLRDALAVQRAEWAYLNRPDRIRELATINFERLGLLPFEPEQFGQPDQVSFPLPPSQFLPDDLGEIRTIDLMGATDPDAANTATIVPTDEVQVP